MKKLFLLSSFSSLLLLAACGSSEEESTVEKEDTEVQAEESSEPEESAEDSDLMSREEYEAKSSPGMADEPVERDYSTATEDVMAFVEYNDLDILIDEVHDYKILERYEIPEVHESGRNRINFNGFKQEFGLFLVEDEFGIKRLMYAGEHINETNLVVEYYGGMTFVTDTGEQLSPPSGVFESEYNKLITNYEPGVSRVGFSSIELENQDDIPNEIRVIFDEIYTSIDGTFTEDNLSDKSEGTFYKK